MAHFKLHGPDFVQIVRDLMFERTWQTALQMLQDGIDIGTDDAVAILSGRKTLVGCNSFELVDEDLETQKAHEAKLADMLLGVAKFKDHWFQPYGFADRFSAEDLPYAGQNRNRWIQPPGDLSIPTWIRAAMNGGDAWGAYRCLFYALDPQQDLVTYARYAAKQCGILWKEVPAPPFWWRPRRPDPTEPVAHNSWLDGASAIEFQAALNEYTLSRPLRHMTPTPLRITEIGDSITRAAVMVAADAEPDEEPSTDLFAMLGRDMIAKGMDPDAAAGVLAAVSGKQDETSPAEQGPVTASPSGYILPGGAFYPCGYHEHRALATRILREVDCKEGVDVEQEADRRGWVRLQKSAMSDDINEHCPRHLTDAQEHTLLEFWAHWCPDRIRETEP